MTKKIILILIIVAITFAGARNIMPNRREMNQVEIVRIMGIDAAANDRVEVTLVRNYANTEIGGAVADENGEESDGEADSGGEEATAAESGAAGDPPNAANTISRTGVTVSAAISQIRRGMEREMLGSHVEYILIGEDAAKTDILKFMDYLSRNVDVRFSARIFVVQGSSAKDFLNRLPEGFILADKLSNFGRNSGVSSISTEKTLADFFRKLTCEFGDGIIPTVSLVERDGQASVELGGYAIIANGNFTGFMDDVAAAGYNLVTMSAPAGTVNISYNDSYVSVRIADFRSRVTFDFNGSNLRRINIATDISASVNEAHSRVDLTSPQVVLELESLASEQFKEQISSAIALSQTQKSDFLEFGDMLRIRHPHRWERLHENWRETLASVPIDVVVNTEISRMQNILR